MKTTRIPLIILNCVFSLLMQAQTTHWNYDPYSYQYDMAMYFNLTMNGEAVGNMSDYEVAAFVGDECRGIAKVQIVANTQYGYIRIRSNEAEGETVTFKVYDIGRQEEFDVDDVTITFQTDTTIGVPSSPFPFSLVTFILGDVDGDGVVDLVDATLVISYYLGKPVPKFVMKAADVDGDGQIDFTDAVRIINLYLDR